MGTRRQCLRLLTLSPWRQGSSDEGGRPSRGWLTVTSAAWVLCRTCCAASDLPVQTTAADVIQVDSERKGAEEEVLGPLRIWHIVFIVVTLVIIVVTIACCCVEIRIPRSRLEIEETYRVRKMNQQYLRQLERTPDALLRQGKTSSAAAGSASVEQSALPQRGGKSHDLYHVHPAASNHRHQQQQHQQHHRHQQRQRQHQNRSSNKGDNDNDDDDYGDDEKHVPSVAVTDSSARLAKLRKSQMYGVQTPFALTGIPSLQKQKQPGGSGRGGGGG